MFSTEYLRLLSEERERQVNEHLRVRNLIRPHRMQAVAARARTADRSPRRP